MRIYNKNLLSGKSLNVECQKKSKEKFIPTVKENNKTRRSNGKSINFHSVQLMFKSRPLSSINLWLLT